MPLINRTVGERRGPWERRAVLAESDHVASLLENAVRLTKPLSPPGPAPDNCTSFRCCRMSRRTHLGNPLPAGEGSPMFASMLTSEAVARLLSPLAPGIPPGRPAMPETFLVGVCILAMVAAARAAVANFLAALRSA